MVGDGVVSHRRPRSPGCPPPAPTPRPPKSKPPIPLNFHPQFSSAKLPSLQLHCRAAERGKPVCVLEAAERFVCSRASQLLWIHQQLALQEQQEQQPKLPTRCASLCASGHRYRTSRPTWRSASVASSPTGLRSSACTQIAGPTGAVRRMPRPSPSTASLRPHRRRTLCTAVPLSRRSRPAERLQAQPGPWP